MTDIVLLHGWPGAASDFRRVIPLLPAGSRVLTPDLLGFGSAFAGPVDVGTATADAHAERILSLIRSEGLERPIIAGYDIGSRVGQALARLAPDAVGGLVATPAYPGIAERSLVPEFQARYWYQHFHRLDLAGELLDGNHSAVRTYLSHIWNTWSLDPGLTASAAFDELVADYARLGAFSASIAWYRDNLVIPPATVITVPTIMVWPEDDVLFDISWADRLDDWFTDVALVPVPGSGHFVPLEAPQVFADAITQLAERRH